MMFRAIRRSPGSYVTAALTMATGVGAVVAMFSVYAAVVLTPMSVDDPDDLVAVEAANPQIPNVPSALSWIRFDNSLRHAQTFSHLAAYDSDSASLTADGGPPEQLTVLRVSSHFFRLLGTKPLDGRVFSAADDQPNGPEVCILSYELWQARFGGRPIVGRHIDLDGRPFEVIGVLTPRFTVPWSGSQLFLPRLFDTSTLRAEHVNNGSSFLSVIGRLKDGVTIEQAQAELDGLASDYSQRFAGRLDAANSTAARPFVDTLVGDSRQPLVILLAAVGAVLLVACANASTLFLGRLLARQRETAVRQALGASRQRIVVQSLLESLGLSVLAGVAGLAIAWALLRAVTAWLGSSLPDGAAFVIDRSAFGAAAVIVVIAAFLVGLVPALYVTRPVMSTLLTFARGEAAAGSGRRLRALLVAAEVALSCALLIGATLMVLSLVRLNHASPGFDTRRTAAGLISLAPARYSSDERQAAFATEVVERLRHSAGVQNAAAVFGLPLGDGFSYHQYVVAGQPIPPPSERQRAGIRLVTEQYFDVMQIRLKAGRLFTALDRLGAPLVCIVNESLARKVAVDGNPIGQAILRGREADLRYEIVGVVEDIRSYGLRRPVVEEIFYPLRQLPWPHFALVASTDGDPAALRRTMESAVAEVDPRQPVARFATMDHRLDQTWGGERVMASITAAFAAIGLLMAVVGLYGVLAQSVASRTTEIGLRVAVGASRAQIVRLIVKSGMSIAASGIVTGCVMAAIVGRYLGAQLYDVNPYDPWVFGGVASVFGSVALVACLAPSWRAATLDPIQALRQV
jgi:putative ABC transport system permease protein